MTTNNGCCGGTATSACDSTIAELPRYYPRQLITPDDLTLEQNYFRDRMRRHNRLLHGWGVVCGAIVCPATTTNADGTLSFTPWKVNVQRGYILGPYGDEIIIDCPRTVDLRTVGISGVTGQPCNDAPDPWCSQVFTPPSTTNVLYIAVQYKQSMVRPVRVQPVGCGCDSTNCEYSRLQDGYQIGVLPTCPICNACDPDFPKPDLDSQAEGPVPACPDCTCGPWVCLAQVTVASDGSGTIQQIDNSSCRRMVLSFCNFWWMSSSSTGTSQTTVTGITSTQSNSVPPQVSADGKTQVPLTVTGTNLEIGSNVVGGPKVAYSFGPGISVRVGNQTVGLQTGLTSVQLTVLAQTNVTPGIYNLTIINADCSVVLFGNAIQVMAATGATLSTRATKSPAVQKAAASGSRTSHGASPKTSAKTKDNSTAPPES